MNFIQRNPSDPKHGEFHDGEYEYWPMDDSIKTKSISIPAALISGLELLAAAAAAALLAVALSALYVLSSPLAISENSAVINTNIYNNHDDLGVVYTLISLETPDNVQQGGILLHDEQTLSLQNLNGGTTYLLKYYDSEQNEVGQFRFTTPGEKQKPETPEPSTPVQLPDEPIGSMEKPTSEKEAPTEPGDEATESTTETTEPDNNRPPVIVRPRPTPRPDPEEDYTPDFVPEPEIPSETEPNPKPDAVSGNPKIESFVSEEAISGVLEQDDLAYTEYFVFINIPDENYEYNIEKNGTYWSKADYADGTLTISVTSALNFGEKIKTKVTVYTATGTASKQSVIAAPKLESASISHTENGDGTYNFTITATASIDDDTDGIEPLTLMANFSPYVGAESTELPMEQDRNNPTQYTAVINSVTVLSGEKTATAIVEGYCERIGALVFNQSYTAKLDYS